MSILKYQSGGNTLGGMTDVEKEALNKRVADSNKSSLDKYINRPIDPIEQTQLTTTYVGNLTDTGRQITSNQWEGMRRADPNEVVTGDRYGKKDNSKNFPASHYKILADDKGQPLHVPQYSVRQAPDWNNTSRYHYREILNSTQTGTGPKNNPSGQYYISAKGEMKGLNSVRAKSRANQNAIAKAKYDKDMADYNNQVVKWRAEGMLSPITPTSTTTPVAGTIQTLPRRILYNKDKT